MAPVSDQQLRKLAPYIGRERPDHRGELSMFCPLHNDTKRSASLNLNMGAWFCHAGCGGGSVRQLIDAEDTWVRADGRIKEPSAIAYHSNGALDTRELMDDVLRWHQNLVHDCSLIHRLYKLRGITRRTIRQALIGYDGRYFKIPVFSPDRDLWNVRTYDPNPGPDRRKIWGVRGLNQPRIYPASILDLAGAGEAVLFCEGEWDALLTLQTGYLAVTYTCGAGKPWHHEWDIGFAGLKVYLCHDADEQGERGNQIVGTALNEIAEVFVCKLPFEKRAKDGLDMTDYLRATEEPLAAVGSLLNHAKPF
jgi:hypothetical protein